MSSKDNQNYQTNPVRSRDVTTGDLGSALASISAEVTNPQVWKETSTVNSLTSEIALRVLYKPVMGSYEYARKARITLDEIVALQFGARHTASFNLSGLHQQISQRIELTDLIHFRKQVVVPLVTADLVSMKRPKNQGYEITSTEKGLRYFRAGLYMDYLRIVKLLQIRDKHAMQIDTSQFSKLTKFINNSLPGIQFINAIDPLGEMEKWVEENLPR